MPATLVLPVIVVLAGFFGFHDVMGMGGVLGIVVLVYTFVLLGSMTLNAWLLLRHPRTLRDRTLPRRASIWLVVLWSLTAAWIIVLAIGALEGLSVVFGIAIAVVSIISFVQALGAHLAAAERIPLASIELSPRARVLAWVYIVAAAIALLAALYFSIVDGSLSAAAGALGGPGTIALLVLGLPWSHPLYFISVLVSFVAPVQFAGIPTLLAALGVVANVVLVSLVLFDPVRRVKIVNWLFRLTPKRPVQPID